MGSKYVKLTIPEKLYGDSLAVAREFGYSNLQDLTVESLRKQVLELKREQALSNLKKNFGSLKAGKRLTRKEMEELAIKHTPARAKEITKKYIS